jgi:hypothetical protein
MQPAESHDPSVLIELTVLIGFIIMYANLKNNNSNQMVWVLCHSMTLFHNGLFVV